jgi:hypothetical protein
VLSIMASNGCIYAGCQDGVVHVWDLETRSRIRSIVVGGEVKLFCFGCFGCDATGPAHDAFFCIGCRTRMSFRCHILAMIYILVFRMDTSRLVSGSMLNYYGGS